MGYCAAAMNASSFLCECLYIMLTVTIKVRHLISPGWLEMVWVTDGMTITRLCHNAMLAVDFDGQSQTLVSLGG